MEVARFGGFSVRTECARCGQPLPLDAPSRTATCHRCQGSTPIPDEVWQRVLEAYDSHHETLVPGQREASSFEVNGLRVRYEVGPAIPRCEKCGTELPTEAASVGAQRALTCPRCGDPAVAEDAPAWLRELVSSARVVYRAHAVPAGNAVPLDSLEQAVRPVALTCPQCGGPLTASAESPRLIPCRYCETDVYLPSEVWERLHPVRTVQPFHVRFAGPSRTDRERMAAVRWEQREQRLAEERRQQQVEARRQQREREYVAREAAEARRLEHLARLSRQAWRAAAAATGALWLFVGGAWMVGPDGWLVSLILGAIAVAAIIVATHYVGRPIDATVQNGFDWLLFITWFWLPFVLLFPVVGSIMALVRSLILWRGRFAACTIESGGSRSHHDAVTLRDGEGNPGAVLFLAIALLWPLAMVGAFGGIAGG